MRVIIHTTETINHTTTIEVDFEAMNAYYRDDIGIVVDGHIPNWAIKNYLRDQRDIWLDQINASPVVRFTNWNHTLDEINVIS